jgi:hypothetical protein
MSSMYGSMGSKNNIPKGYNMGSIQNYSPEQMNLFRSLFSNVGPDSYLSKLAGGDEETFSQMEAPALRQFSGIQGNLASRFSGMGTGARKSSGFQNTINQAGSDFAQDLQSRRQGLQSQAIKDLMSMSGELLNQRPQENFLTPKPPSFLQTLLGALGQGAGQMVGSLGSGFGYKNILGG